MRIFVFIIFTISADTHLRPNLQRGKKEQEKMFENEEERRVISVFSNSGGRKHQKRNFISFCRGEGKNGVAIQKYRLGNEAITRSVVKHGAMGKCSGTTGW